MVQSFDISPAYPAMLWGGVYLKLKDLIFVTVLVGCVCGGGGGLGADARLV